MTKLINTHTKIKCSNRTKRIDYTLKLLLKAATEQACTCERLSAFQ